MAIQNTPSRTFKVMEGGFTQPAGAAELRFRGLWLRTAGFHPGATFSLTNPEPGVLQLRVNGPAQLTSKDFAAAMEKFTALGL